MQNTEQEHTQIEKNYITDKTLDLLIDGLILFGVTKEQAKWIVVAVHTEEMAKELMNYMIDHQTATPEELKEMAWLILEKDSVRRSLGKRGGKPDTPVGSEEV